MGLPGSFSSLALPRRRQLLGLVGAAEYSPKWYKIVACKFDAANDLLRHQSSLGEHVLYIPTRIRENVAFIAHSHGSTFGITVAHPDAVQSFR